MSNVNSFNPKSPTLQFTIWLTIISFIIVIAFSYFMKVEVVVSGRGRIIPQDHVQVVQSEFGGRILEINVVNGDIVYKNQGLVQLDTSDTKAELKTIESEFERLDIESNRIKILTQEILTSDLSAQNFQSEALNKFTLSPENSNQDYFNEQQKLLISEIQSLQSSLNQLDARLDANEKSMSVTEANIERIESSIEFQEERMKISQSLLERGASNKLANIDVEDNFSDLKKQREVYLRELDQKSSVNYSLLAERKSIIDQILNEKITLLSEIQARQETLNQQIIILRRKLVASTIKAPVDGTIDQIQIFTVGGSVEPGQELMRIVPQNSNLIIEATFSNENTGFMKVGQRANISLDAYPSSRFGYVQGEVVNISADSIKIDSLTGKTWGFVVQIRPDEPYLLYNGQEFAISPGMTIKADIITEKRRIISYFLAPIIDTMQNSLGER